MRRGWILVCALAACRPDVARRTPRETAAAADEQALPRSSLEEMLRQVVLQSYSASAEGFDESYLEHVDRNDRLVMFGIGPDESIVGFHRRKLLDARPFSGDVGDVVSKALEVHLSVDGSVAWVFDELSYRVTMGEKRAFVPFRYTAVYELDGERWELVQGHLSYGIRDDEALTAAGEGQSPIPASLGVARASGTAADSVRRLVLDVIRDEGETARKHVATGAGTLVVGSDADRELRGDAIAAQPTVRALYGYDLAVRVTGLRVHVSGKGANAWAAATLRIEGTRDDRRVAMGVRATWVLEKSADGWRVMQTHVSVPVTEAHLRTTITGD